MTGYTRIDTVLDAVNRGRIFRFITKSWSDGELRDHLRDAFAYYDALANREQPPRLLG